MPRPIGPDTPIRLTQSRGGLPEGTTGKARDYPQTPAFWTEPAVWIYPDNTDYYPRWVPLRCVEVIAPDEATPEQHAEYAVNRELTVIESEPALRELADRITDMLGTIADEMDLPMEDLGLIAPGQAFWGLTYRGVPFSLSLGVTE